jgi:hypothetical protein
VQRIKKKKQVCFWQGKKGNNKVDLQLTQANITFVASETT